MVEAATTSVPVTGRPTTSSERGWRTLDTIATTRSIHRFRRAAVSDEALEVVLHAASRGPSGGNRQPFRFVVLRDGQPARQAKALLGAEFRRQWNAKRDRDGYRSVEAGRASNRKSRTAAAMDRFVDSFEEIPVVVLACLIRHREPYCLEGASIYPACQNLLLAAAEVGLGGTISLWHTGIETELKDLLGIPDAVGIEATIPLGHPKGAHGPLRRRPLVELVHDGRWGTRAPWLDQNR